jgi:MOSC domain-containing protein YiiM
MLHARQAMGGLALNCTTRRTAPTLRAPPMPFNPESPLAKLMATLPRAGAVEWIGVRPARDVPMVAAERVQAKAGAGLTGDRYKGGSGKRGLTLIQAEHLPVIAMLAGLGAVDAATLRRNIVVSGIPLIALKERRFRIGDVILEGTEPCDPCSRMEEALGAGGYNAMRGHGGLCARIIEGGTFALGDAVVPL